MKIVKPEKYKYYGLLLLNLLITQIQQLILRSQESKTVYKNLCKAYLHELK